MSDTNGDGRIAGSINGLARASDLPSKPGPCALVLFGATGDLTRRKLLPALYSLHVQGLLPERYAIVAVARRERDIDGYREDALEAVRAYAPAVPVNRQAWDTFADKIHYIKAGLHSDDDFRRLGETLAPIEQEHATEGNRLFYLATPPEAFSVVVEGLGRHALTAEQPDGPWRRVVIEKPFGSDLASSLELNRRLTAVISERQIFRIDHYLGKETVQNILVMRFANRLFELLWSRLYVDNVQLTVAETLGVEGRGGYFDESGTIRDIIQNHGLQILTAIAAEPPVTLEADAIRDEKVKVLRAIRTPLRHDVAFGQYDAGLVNGQQTPAYRSEPGVAADSCTETYAALRLYVDNWRWAGVPFYIRSGKRLARRLTEVVLQLRDVPDVLYSRLTCSEMPANRITIRIQPNEGIEILMGAKEPGAGMRVQPVRMRFAYEQEFGKAIPDAYERLLINAMLGDASLFARHDEVDLAWQILTPVLHRWGDPLTQPNAYAPGSWGPSSGDQLLAADGRNWWNSG